MTRVACWVLRGVVSAIALALTSSVLPVHAQPIQREFGVQAYTLIGEEGRFGSALYVARRLGPRARISLLAGADVGSGQTIGRAEGLVHLLLSPSKRTGAGGYLAGGLAVDVAERSQARIVALVGVEGSPGGKQGWMLEAGVGGGWRVAAGWRWRR